MRTANPLATPMALTRPPRVPDEPVPILTDDAVRALLRACEGRTWLTAAIDRYLREQRMQRDAERPDLWLGHRGSVTSDGILQILERRCAGAGMSRIGAHAFRHRFAHSMLSSGLQETDLMRLAGWRSRQMVARYAAATGTDRAIAAYRRPAPSDRFWRYHQDARLGRAENPRR